MILSPTTPSPRSASRIGHWAALDEIYDSDDDGNVVRADAILDDVRNSIVVTQDTDRLVAAAGLQNMVVVDTPDALLIVPKDGAQNVRDLTERLDERGRDDLL